VRDQDISRATVRWVGGLFAATVLLQRFSLPGSPVALVLPVLIIGGVWGVAAGLASFDRFRLSAWLLASGAMAAAIGVQQLVVADARISLLSWGLFVTTWAPFTLRLTDRRLDTFLATLRVVVGVTLCLAVVNIVMLVSQLAGLAYKDWLADVVPSNLLLQGFVITYPLDYGSEIYRANAWIGLEPSIVSAQLGVGLVAALLVRARRTTVVTLAAGLVCATSGSGFAIIIVAVLVMLVLPGRQALQRYVLPSAAALVLTVITPIGQQLIARIPELFLPNSSANLRAVLPYQYLWDRWVDNALFVLVGGGPGSSQAIVGDSGIEGLLVPTPVKIFFDYGLVAGVLLAAFIIICYFGGPSRSLAFSLFISLWTLQPGTTVAVLVAPLLLLVTWWSPRSSPVVETLTTPSSRGTPRPTPRAVPPLGKVPV
jgi:hypothetical protein